MSSVVSGVTGALGSLVGLGGVRKPKLPAKQTDLSTLSLFELDELQKKLEGQVKGAKDNTSGLTGGKLFVQNLGAQKIPGQLEAIEDARKNLVSQGVIKRTKSATQISTLLGSR